MWLKSASYHADGHSKKNVPLRWRGVCVCGRGWGGSDLLTFRYGQVSVHSFDLRWLACLIRWHNGPHFSYVTLCTFQEPQRWCCQRGQSKTEVGSRDEYKSVIMEPYCIEHDVLITHMQRQRVRIESLWALWSKWLQFIYAAKVAKNENYSPRVPEMSSTARLDVSGRYSNMWKGSDLYVSLSPDDQMGTDEALWTL